MKQVIFKSVKIQNFLSVGEIPLELNFNSGISLITGENRDKGGRNGVGKSTVVESLYWSLFGTTMRDIKRDKIIHNQSSGNCIVTLYFNIISSNKTDQYILTRSADPNKVSLLCNNVDITRGSMPKTDELIKELIGANEEVFQNAVIMTANNTMPFMAQKKVDKRKFVEGVLHLGVFGEMLLQITSDFNDCKKQHDIIINQFNEKQKNLELFKGQFEKIEITKKNKISNLSSKIEDNNNFILKISKSDNVEETKIKLSELITKKENKIISLKNLSEECNKESLNLWKSKQEIDLKLENLNEEYFKLKNTDTSCPTCKRDFQIDVKHLCTLQKDTEDKISSLKKDLNVINQSIKKQSKGCKDIENIISNLQKDLENHRNEKQSLELIHQQIVSFQKRNLELEQEILELKNTDNDFKSLIENAEKEIVVVEEEISNIQKKLSILEIAKYVVSEEGVKTFIIKKMLSVLNARLNFYLQSLEAPCKCEFNEVFEETIINDQGKECSYFNFSGGERKRIDLAILFMFQDLLRMQTGTSFSLSMYDELFDSALDEKGVDKIMDVLKNRVEKYNENIYIISHNKSSIKSGINQVILLEKHNGKTRIVDQIN